MMKSGGPTAAAAVPVAAVKVAGLAIPRAIRKPLVAGGKSVKAQALAAAQAVTTTTVARRGHVVAGMMKSAGPTAAAAVPVATVKVAGLAIPRAIPKPLVAGGETPIMLKAAGSVILRVIRKRPGEAGRSEKTRRGGPRGAAASAP
jgi:hypothetical protein